MKKLVELQFRTLANKPERIIEWLTLNDYILQIFIRWIYVTLYEKSLVQLQYANFHSMNANLVTATGKHYENYRQFVKNTV